MTEESYSGRYIGRYADELRHRADICERAYDLLVVGAVVLLPVAVLVHGEGYYDWIAAGNRILNFESVYGVGDPNEVNPRDRFGYVYLPSFAIVLALLFTPIRLLAATLERLGLDLSRASLDGSTSSVGALATDSFLVAGLEVVVTGLFFFAVHLLTAYLAASFFETERKQLLAIGAVLFTPTLFMETAILGPNMLMAALALSAVKLVQQERWFWAAVLIGLSTFKFVGLPFCVVLFGCALATKDRRAVGETISGGLASQIPNAIYFAGYPDELLLILRERGAISTHANTLSETSLFHLPFLEFGLQQWYIDVGFPVAVLLFSALGAVFATSTNPTEGLIGGFAIGFFSTSYLVPAEHRTAPFFILTILLLIDVWGPTARRLLLLVFVGDFYTTLLWWEGPSGIVMWILVTTVAGGIVSALVQLGMSVIPPVACLYGIYSLVANPKRNAATVTRAE